MAILNAEDIKASFSLFCCVYGIGTLGMPGNYARAGPIYASIALAAMAFSNVYATVAVSKCLLVVPKNVETLSDLGEYCFGKPGRYVTLCAQMGVCLMVPMVFLVLGSSLLQTLFLTIDAEVWIVLMSMSILPVALTPTLKEGALAALAGCVGTIFADFISLGILMYYTSGHPESIVAPSVTFEQVVSCFGNLSLAYGAAVVIPAIQREHSDPTRMPRVVFFTLTLISVLFLAIAITGYVYVGCQIPGNLLFAISSTKLGFEANRGGIVLAFLAMQLHITIAFTVIVHPAFFLGERQFLGLHKIIEEYEPEDGREYTRQATPSKNSTSINEKPSYSSLRERHVVSIADIEKKGHTNEEFTRQEILKMSLFRIAVISVMTIIAIILKDHFHALADFVGASAMSLSCIILPLVFYMKLFWGKLPIYEKIIGSIVAICCSCLAVYLSIHFFKELISPANTTVFPFCPAKYQEVVFYKLQ